MTKYWAVILIFLSMLLFTFGSVVGCAPSGSTLPVEGEGLSEPLEEEPEEEEEMEEGEEEPEEEAGEESAEEESEESGEESEQ